MFTTVVTIKNLQFPAAEIPSMEIGGSLDVLLLAGELLAIDSSGSWGVRFCCCVYCCCCCCCLSV